MSEQKPEPLSAQELLDGKTHHSHVNHIFVSHIDCWTCRMCATIDARDADLATARRTMDEMQARIEELERKSTVLDMTGQYLVRRVEETEATRDSLAEQLKAKEAELQRRIDNLIASYQAKVDDFARETRRSSDYATLLRTVREVLMNRGCRPAPWPKHCTLCQIITDIDALLAEPVAEAALKPAPETAGEPRE